MSTHSDSSECPDLFVFSHSEQLPAEVRAHLRLCETCRALAQLRAGHSQPIESRDDCTEAEVLIGMACTETLTAAEREQLERHVVRCPGCALTLATLLVDDDLDEISAPENAHSTPEPQVAPSWRRNSRALGAAAVVAVAMAGMFVLFTRDSAEHKRGARDSDQRLSASRPQKAPANDPEVNTRRSEAIGVWQTEPRVTTGGAAYVPPPPPFRYDGEQVAIHLSQLDGWNGPLGDCWMLPARWHKDLLEIRQPNGTWRDLGTFRDGSFWVKHGYDSVAYQFERFSDVHNDVHGSLSCDDTVAIATYIPSFHSTAMRVATIFGENKIKMGLGASELILVDPAQEEQARDLLEQARSTEKLAVKMLPRASTHLVIHARVTKTEAAQVDTFNGALVLIVKYEVLKVVSGRLDLGTLEIWHTLPVDVEETNNEISFQPGDTYQLVLTRSPIAKNIINGNPTYLPVGFRRLSAPKDLCNELTPVAKRGPVAKYLQHWPGLYVREGEEIVDAPKADVEVAMSYPWFRDKGKLHNGQRITLMARCRRYRVGEAVRVIHVLEAAEPGHEVYVMGPKRIVGESIDGAAPAPASTAEDLSYDGAVLNSPAVDYNYEITEYRFRKPGSHTIQWKGGGHPIQGELNLVSNTLHIEVVP